MKHGIHIEGGTIEREAVEVLADAIGDIFASAAECRMDQATVVKALDLLQSIGGVAHVAVSNCQVVAK